MSRCVAELDATPPASPAADDPRLRQFLSVTQSHAGTRTQAEPGDPATIGATQSDEIISTCQLLALDASGGSIAASRLVATADAGRRGWADDLDDSMAVAATAR